MHHIVEPPKPDCASGHPVSRRALLEGSASAGLAAATIGWGGASLHLRNAHAADPAPGAWSARQIAAFRIREAVAQA